MTSMSEAWELARSTVQKAQQRQKKQHDSKAKDPKFAVGRRVLVYMPAAKSTKAHKFARPFEGPYRIIAMYDNGADVCWVDHPSSPSIRVSLDRLRHCPSQLVDGTSRDYGAKKKASRKKKKQRKK